MTGNQLLDHLSSAELRRLLPQGQRVLLHSGDALASQDAPAPAVVFPFGGVICLVKPLDAHPPLQVGMVGREGALGAQLLLGLPASPVNALVQAPGEGWSLSAPSLRRALPTSHGLRRMLARYLLVQMRDAATNSACLHYHALQARLARWLLMGHDRSTGEGVAVTHETLAHLLGVRRVGVTVAASGLQDDGLIHYHRGWVTVSNRAGLESAACSCYMQDRDGYLEGMRFAPWTAPREWPGVDS